MAEFSEQQAHAENDAMQLNSLIGLSLTPTEASSVLRIIKTLIYIGKVCGAREIMENE